MTSDRIATDVKYGILKKSGNAFLAGKNFDVASVIIGVETKCSKGFYKACHDTCPVLHLALSQLSLGT